MNKQRDIELARYVGFNTEHAATNEYLHRFAEMVREEEKERILKICQEGLWDGEGLRQHVEGRNAALS